MRLKVDNYVDNVDNRRRNLRITLNQRLKKIQENYLHRQPIMSPTALGVGAQASASVRQTFGKREYIQNQ